MVLQYLQNIGKVYENVILDYFIIMPNHIHYIIALQNEFPSPDNGSPWAATPTLWQRYYHEHIIRNENELQRIKQYITNNPAKWQEDKYFVQFALFPYCSYSLSICNIIIVIIGCHIKSYLDMLRGGRVYL